ncbi:succinylglutamate desuccinylase [Aquitalea magnusonii]|nr:succinylglutamate desuccinylase [Aquitalea magnusonii]
MIHHQHPLTSSCLGTQRQLSSFHFGQPGSSAGKAYIQASLHADELPGMLTAWELKQALQVLEQEGKIAGEIILVPQANPIGHAQSLLGYQLGRFELASGQNFNRHYPQLTQAVYAAVKHQLGKDAKANTALIRQAMRQHLQQLAEPTELVSLRKQLLLLAADADIVLDLHCDSNAALHVYTGTPLWPQCEPLARYLQSHAQLLATESGDYPFDEACSQTWWELEVLCRQDGLDVPIEMACLSVTVELRGQHQVAQALARQDARAILDFLCLRGLITGEAPALPPLPYPATPLSGSENLQAPHPGVVNFLLAPGTLVAAGQAVAEIIDPLQDKVAVLSSRYGGMLYAQELHPYATAGMTVAKVATAQSFKTGKLLSA